MNNKKLERGIALLNAVARKELSKPSQIVVGRWACGHKGTARKGAIRRMKQLLCPKCQKPEAVCPVCHRMVNVVEGKLATHGPGPKTFTCPGEQW